MGHKLSHEMLRFILVGESYMRWTKRRKEEIFTRILVVATLAILAVGGLVALVAFFYFRE
jgi:hypothetical protein